jgi:predicted kinase
VLLFDRRDQDVQSVTVIHGFRPAEGRKEGVLLPAYMARYPATARLGHRLWQAAGARSRRHISRSARLALPVLWRILTVVASPVFVLIGGWPGSGKSTLAAGLAAELQVPLLAKDEIKEALTDALGRPESVPESQRLGRAAVLAMLRVAQRCPGAVLDSTWFDYTRPLLADLPGRLVEVRCLVPHELARARYQARAALRHPGHLDHLRSDAELWGQPVPPLHVGPLVEVDTSRAVDVPALARAIEAHRLTRPDPHSGAAAPLPR